MHTSVHDSSFSTHQQFIFNFLSQLTRDNGKLYGRGSTDDKGPVLGWIHALQGFQACGIDLPVNLKFCFEGPLNIRFKLVFTIVELNSKLGSRLGELSQRE